MSEIPIAAGPFSLDNADLTPTRKILRPAIPAACRAAFDSLCDETDMRA